MTVARACVETAGGEGQPVAVDLCCCGPGYLLRLLLLVVAVALEFVLRHADAGRVAGLIAEGALQSCTAGAEVGFVLVAAACGAHDRWAVVGAVMVVALTLLVRVPLGLVRLMLGVQRRGGAGIVVVDDVVVLHESCLDGFQVAGGVGVGVGLMHDAQGIVWAAEPTVDLGDLEAFFLRELCFFEVSKGAFAAMQVLLHRAGLIEG